MISPTPPVKLQQVTNRHTPSPTSPPKKKPTSPLPSFLIHPQPKWNISSFEINLFSTNSNGPWNLIDNDTPNLRSLQKKKKRVEDPPP